MGIDGYICIAVFALVILGISLNLLHMALVALLGVSALMVTGIITTEVRSAGILAVYSINSLFIASMVIIRCLEPTNIFPVLAQRLFRLARGDGRLLLFLLFAVVAPLCAVFPNATVVLLFLPLCAEVARLFAMPLMPVIILLVFIANGAGLLTLIGGVPSYIVGTALKMDFLTYLREATPGAMTAMGALFLSSPFLFPTIWNARRNEAANQQSTLQKTCIQNPTALSMLAIIFTAAVLLFLTGEYLPVPISPVFTAIVAGTLALIVVHVTGLADFGRVIRSIDWETILFFDCVFMIVAAMEASDVFTATGHFLAGILGSNALVTAIWIIFSLGALSSVMPNIPLAAVMLPTLVNYLLDTGFLNAAQAAAGVTAMPDESKFIILSMLFGVTLGGNATMLGAIPNIIAVSAAREAGERITFGAFARFGVPATLIQLGAYALYILFYLR